MTFGTMMLLSIKWATNGCCSAVAVDVLNGYAKIGQPFCSASFQRARTAWEGPGERRSRSACGNRVAEAS